MYPRYGRLKLIAELYILMGIRQDLHRHFIGAG
jgi:hypothetical protein